MTQGKLRSGILLGIALLLPSSGAGKSLGDDLDSPVVSAIEVQSDGPLERISRQSLDRLIVIEPGEPLRTGAARATVKRLFATGLFHDIQILMEPQTDGGVQVRVELTEVKLLRKVEVKGGDKVPEQELRAALQLSAGQPYETDQVERSLERLRGLFRQHGYYEAQARAEPEFLPKQGSVRLRIQIEPGPRAVLSQFELDVAGPIRPDDVRDLLRLKAGDSYSNAIRDADLREVSRWLVRQGYLNPLVYVAEGPRYSPQDHSVELGLRVSPREKTEISFLGLPESFDAPFSLAIYRNGDASEIVAAESALELQEALQLAGYLQAVVEHRLEGDPLDPDRVEFRVTAGPRGRLKRIRLAGDVGDIRTEETLNSLLETRTSGFWRSPRFSSELLGNDEERLSNFWSQRGYLNARVTSQMEWDSGEATLTLTIDRGEPYTVGTLSIEGNTQIDTGRLQREVRSAPGEQYSPLQLTQDRANLSAVYENLGFRDVDIQIEVLFEEQKANVLFTIYEGPQYFTDAVLVTGNRRTREGVIRSEINLVRGEPLSLERILSAETALYNLAIFNRVQIQEVPSFQDETARSVIVQVDEAQRYSLVYGFGYSSFEGLRGTVGVTNNNILGTARSLSLALRAGAQRQRGSLTYSLPRFFGWKIPAVLVFSADNEQAQTRRTGTGSRAIRGRPFDSFRLTASAQTEVRLSQRESAFFRLEYDRVRSQVPNSLETALEFFREQQKIDLSAISFSYLNESRDNPSDSSSGFFLAGDTRLASRFLGSEEELWRVFAQGQYYRSLTPRVVWASALRVGFILPYGQSVSVPISERFFSGGAATLRGIPQDLAGPLLRDEKDNIVLVDEFGQRDPSGRPVPLGGEAVLIFNSEIRFPLYQFVRGVAFYDLGNVYAEAADLFRQPPTHSVGFGLHFKTPVGPVRFDIGFNPNPPDAPGFSNLVFHLTLGHPF